MTEIGRRRQWRQSSFHFRCHCTLDSVRENIVSSRRDWKRVNFPVTIHIMESFLCRLMSGPDFITNTELSTKQIWHIPFSMVPLLYVDNDTCNYLQILIDFDTFSDTKLLPNYENYYSCEYFFLVEETGWHTAHLYTSKWNSVQFIFENSWKLSINNNNPTLGDYFRAYAIHLLHLNCQNKS